MSAPALFLAVIAIPLFINYVNLQGDRKSVTLWTSYKNSARLTDSFHYQLHLSRMKSAVASTLAALSLAAVAQARTFTVYNGCPFTVWPAMFTDLVGASSTWPSGIHTEFSSNRTSEALSHLTPMGAFLSLLSLEQYPCSLHFNM